MNGTPLIVDIVRDSRVDGPGIRTVVFFKGCPLRCVFCQNPEAQETVPEIAFFLDKCIQCDHCAEACSRGAIQVSLQGRIVRDRCDACGQCAEACPTGAIRRIGRSYDLQELETTLLRDESFHRCSNGGVTFSGGECTMFPDYLAQLLKVLKRHDAHVVLQTCGWFDYDRFAKQLLPCIDLIQFDLKFADPELHERFTGRSNAGIVENLRRLLHENPRKVEPRIPLIPGITATEANLFALVRLLRDAGALTFRLLPYNPLGFSMWEALGRSRPNVPDHFMDRSEEERIYDRVGKLLRSNRNSGIPGRSPLDQSSPDDR